MREIDLYGRIDEPTLRAAMDKAEWVLITDLRVMEEEDVFISNFYGKCSLFGCTDYSDHRNDSIEDIKRLCYDRIENRLMQNFHYYRDGRIFDMVICKPYMGGWSVYSEWKN